MYSQRIRTTRPGCMLFLIDRSYSMARPSVDDPTTSLGQGVADVVNRLLLELVLRAIKSPDRGPEHYYDIGVVGYGQSATGDCEAVEAAFGGPLQGRMLVSPAELAENPLRLVERTLAGRDRDAPQMRAPVWFEPCAGYSTPTCAAIEFAGAIVARWIRDHPDSFPPIVVNITDGAVTDQGSDGHGFAVWAERLRGLHTSDGNVIFLNALLAAERVEPTFFPASADGLPPVGAELFAASSELPQPMIGMARELGLHVPTGARGLVCNADLASIVNFLQIGTNPLAGAAHAHAA